MIRFGIAPAFVLSKSAVAQSDRQARTIRSSSGRFSVFLACQVGLALLLLSGAILMIRSFIHLLNVDPGSAPAAFWSRECLLRRLNTYRKISCRAAIPACCSASEAYLESNMLRYRRAFRWTYRSRGGCRLAGTVAIRSEYRLSSEQRFLQSASYPTQARPNLHRSRWPKERSSSSHQ